MLHESQARPWSDTAAFSFATVICAGTAQTQAQMIEAPLGQPLWLHKHLAKPG